MGVPEVHWVALLFSFGVSHEAVADGNKGFTCMPSTLAGMTGKLRLLSFGNMLFPCGYLGSSYGDWTSRGQSLMQKLQISLGLESYSVTSTITYW